MKKDKEKKQTGRTGFFRMDRSIEKVVLALFPRI